jgi:asparagine synthase (glutamine-hydrolysing)
MCGILGIYKLKKVDKNQFEEQLNIINHRGPDDSGTWFNGDQTLALGSKRLAIQDLSPKGHMPMASDDERFIIAFNGEIYNHFDIRVKLSQQNISFKSNSDTETVLQAFMYWGADCLNQLNGMFAIAIFDQKKRQLFIARDRAGEKPLYYWKHTGGFSCSSELKQLLLDDDLTRKLNPTALKQYLENGFLKGDQSFIKDVFQLPPAHFLQYNIESGQINLQRYWGIPDFKPGKATQEELLDEFDVLMDRAVKRQMIADVPLGVLLSGGVDSSLVTAYAAKHTQKLRTFHISFDGFGKYNEAEYARTVSKVFNTEHVELSGNDMTFEMIDEALNFYDEPLGDSSMLPTILVSQLTKQYVTVALGGDGGDELFGGYTTYASLLKQRGTIERVPQSLRVFAAKMASALPIGFKGRNFLKQLPGKAEARFLHNRLFDAHSIKSLLATEIYNEIKSIKSKAGIYNSSDFIYNVTRYDFENYLPEDILVKVDRASMSVSLEMRAPFLDKEIIEFAFGKVSGAYKSTESELKILPKLLLKRKMPEEFNVNRKQGFSIPLNDWIASTWFDSFMKEIDDFPVFFNKELVRKMCINIKKGYANSSRLFALVVLSKWIKKYKINY